MSQNDETGGEREQISLSAVYRQLDDRLGADEAPYDVGAGLEQLVTWMSEERPASQAGLSVERVEVERLLRDRELIQVRTKLIERTTSVRMRSSLIATSTVAFLSLLAGVGLLFGLSLVPVHAAVAVVVTVGIIDAVLAGAVAYVHRTTMRSLRDDLEFALGAGEDLHGGTDRRTKQADKPDVADVPTANVADVPTANESVRARTRIGPPLSSETIRYAIDSYARTFRLIVVLVAAAGSIAALVFLAHNL